MCFPRSLIARCGCASIRRVCYGACTLRIFPNVSVGGAHGEACFQSEDHLPGRALPAVFAVSFLAFVAVRSAVAAAADRGRPCWRRRAHSRARWTRCGSSWTTPKASSTTRPDGGLRVQGPPLLAWWERASARLFSKGSDYTHPLHELQPAQLPGRCPTRSRRRRSRRSTPIAAVTEYYGVTAVRRRGAVPLRCRRSKWTRAASNATASRSGELDITGHAKEGWTLESVGGAISIVIPLDQQQAGHARQRDARHGVLPVDHACSSAWSWWYAVTTVVRAAAAGRHARWRSAS